MCGESKRVSGVNERVCGQVSTNYAIVLWCDLGVSFARRCFEASAPADDSTSVNMLQCVWVHFFPIDHKILILLLTYIRSKNLSIGSQIFFSGEYLDEEIQVFCLAKKRQSANL